jgi:NAD(P)-dependent dehydrogenase (short-subunit alcohol dehydrogenase family)
MSKHKVALVTGANKGIGKEIVRQLASQGIRVFLGAGDKGRAEGTLPW